MLWWKWPMVQDGELLRPMTWEELRLGWGHNHESFLYDVSALRGEP